MKADLEALAAKVRQPLTDWEQAEEARVTACKTAIAMLEEIGTLKLNGAGKTFPELFASVAALDADDHYFGEFGDQIKRLKGTTLDKLNAAQDAHIKAEADKAELETLRKAEAARKALEAEAYAEAMKIAAAEKEKAAKEAAEAAAQAKKERDALEAKATAEREAAETTWKRPISKLRHGSLFPKAPGSACSTSTAPRLTATAR